MQKPYTTRMEKRGRKRSGMMSACIVVVLVASVVYFWHPVQSTIPLGYDAGLYKSLIQEYSVQLEFGLLRIGDWSSLPVWMQRMYPPMVGMLGGMIAWLSGVSGAVVGDWLVLWGVSLLAIGLIGVLGWYTIVVVGRTVKDGRMRYSAGLVTSAFALASMVVYSLYRWGYIKQMVAGILLMLMIGFRVRRRHLLVFVMALGAMMTQRPAIVLVAVFFGLAWLFTETKNDRVKQLLAGGSVAVGAVLLYGDMLGMQFGSLVGSVVSSFDVPTVSDGFQDGGTFLTTGEYLQVNWPILVLGVLGTMGLLRTRTSVARVHGAMVAFLLLWVFGQGFFFQRMFGYLDLFLLVSIGWGVCVMRERLPGKKHRRVLGSIVGVLWITQVSISFVSWERVRMPIIEAEEFAFIQELDGIVESGSTVLVPSENYGPWLKGWTDMIVVAPALFDTNKRGTRGQAWQENWRNASAEEKCLAVARDFGTTNIYVRVGSKQTQFTDMTGACFGLIKAGEDPFFALYRLDFDE